MDWARKKLRLNCRWSLHPLRRHNVLNGNVNSRESCELFHKSRDFSERVYSDTAFLSYVTLS